MEVKIQYKGETYLVDNKKSLLESLEGLHLDLASSCRSGTCQTCKMKVVSGKIPEKAQAGLRPTEQAMGYFLPCVCYPEDDLIITDIFDAAHYQVKVLSLQLLNDEVMEVHLEMPWSFSYQPGQYIHVFHESGLSRSYSLASVPGIDNDLILHVKKVPEGIVSSWMHSLKTGTTLRIAGPYGDCFYHDSMKDKPLLLMATSTGLAPLYGILRKALLAEHKGDIWVFHGVEKASQIYYEEKLRGVEGIHYFPCLTSEDKPGYERGFVTDSALSKVKSIKECVAFLSGAPVMVNSASMKLFLAGMSMNAIYKDPFG